MTESKESEHPFRAWFGLPVCIQLAQPFIVPADGGAQEVPFEDAEGKPYNRTMGTPTVVVTTEGNMALHAISGVLQPDGDRVRIDAHIDELGHVRIGIAPSMITHISAIWERHEPPRITIPR